MSGLRMILQVSLGGAVFGSFLGIFGGGLLGGLYGLLIGDLSLGIDGALLGGGVGCLGGALYGVFLVIRERRMGNDLSSPTSNASPQRESEGREGRSRMVHGLSEGPAKTRHLSR
jgi:hypothetical protein